MILDITERDAIAALLGTITGGTIFFIIAIAIKLLTDRKVQEDLTAEGIAEDYR